VRTRYEIKARALSAEEQFIAEADGWDLLEVFDELCSTFDRVLKRSINKPGRTRSRRRSRFRR
jgi:chromatin segregation and condensation protein Rec8/ScpA/Scc1 (kleisin family)